jgi:hypothetical protein
MAKYRVKEKSFIGNVLVEAGTEIEFEGIPSTNLEPLDAPAKKAVTGAKHADKESLVRQQEAAVGINLNDPDDPARKVVKEDLGA